MVKNKKQIFTIILIVALILFFGGIAYAWYNYQSTTSNHRIIAGDMYLILNESVDQIAMTQVFPETVEEARARNDNYITFNVEGINESDKNIYYELTLNHGDDKPEPKTRFRDEDLRFDLIELDSNGNEVSYILSNMGYDTLVNKRIWVETVASNTTTKLVKRYKLRMWLSDTVIISDTDPNKTYTAAEYPNRYATIKIGVAGDFSIKTLPAYYLLKENAITNASINFANQSDTASENKIYLLPGTANDTFPIYYYRGVVNNNNVIFGDYCWQIVRTTDTGGIKLIYNGEITGNGTTCENTARADRVLENQSAFNSLRSSISDVGYMSNARYQFTTTPTAESNSIFGKNVEWDGENYLVIENTSGTASTNKDKDNEHHYSCGTQNTSECPTVRYYYYNNSFINLTGGDTIEDALYKMTGTGTPEVKAKNANYVLNVNDSVIKEFLEEWFENNLTNLVDLTKRDLRGYIEDTIYCNDRSFKTESINTSYPTITESGWNRLNGDLTKYLYFGEWNRFRNNWYSTANVPDLTCPNETDRFSTSNLKAKLDYPIGLLTTDELILVGAPGNNSSSNRTFYLYIEDSSTWLMTPYSIFSGNASESLISQSGNVGNDYVNIAKDVRPVISLKFGTEFELGGNGSPTNPYVVKYN